MRHISRLIAFAAKRDRGEVGRVRFHQQTILWNIARDLPEFA